MKNNLFRPLCCLLLAGLVSVIAVRLVAVGQEITFELLTNEAPQSRLIMTGPPDATGVAAVQGFAGAVPPSSQITITNTVTNVSASAAANADGSFRASIPASVGMPLSITCRKDGVDSASITILTFSPAVSGLLPVVGGAVSDIAIEGLTGYVADGAGLKIVDLTKRGPAAVTGAFFTATPATGVVVSGQHVFLTSAFSNTALRVIDAADPTSPRQVAALFPASGGACLAMGGGQFAVVGGYIAGKGNGLQLVDVTDPTAPAALGFVRLDSSPQAIKVVMNRFAYVAMGAAGVQVIDISDTAAPVVVGSLGEIGNASRLAFISSPFGLLLAVPTNVGVKLFGLFNPMAPPLISTILPGVPTYDVAVTNSGMFAVATGTGGGNTSGVQLFSFRFPFLLYQGGAYRTDGTGARLGAGADLLLLASTGNNPALTLFDTKAPEPATPLTAIPQVSTAMAIAVQGSSTLIAANVRNFGIPNRHQLLWGDSSTPQKPILNQITDGTGTLSAVAFSADGRWALVGANDGSELQVLDAATRQLLGRFQLPFGARINAIKTRGSLAYLAGGEGGLFIVDLGADGYLPQLIGTADTPGGALGLDIAGNYAYIADNLTGLQVVDVANPTAPRVVASIATPAAAQDVRAQGNQLFLAYATFGTGNGLGIYDLTNPSQPNLVGKVATNGYATRVDVAGDLAYLASGDAGLVIIDARNPRQPIVAKNFKTAGSCRDVKADGAMVYTASDSAPAAVIAISPLAQP